MGSIANGERCGRSLISSKDNDRSLSAKKIIPHLYNRRLAKLNATAKMSSREIIDGGKHYWSESFFLSLCLVLFLFCIVHASR